MTLADAIELHRAMLRDELRIPLTASAPPSSDGDLPTVALAVQDGSSVYLSARMLRLIGADLAMDDDKPAVRHGISFAWNASLAALRRDCRFNHPGHTRDERWRGSLCWLIVNDAIRWERDPIVVARMLDFHPRDLQRRLAKALDWIERDIDRKQAAQDRARQRERGNPEPVPSRLSRSEHDFYLRQIANFGLEERIWEGQRRLNPALAEWPAEWARRQDEFLRHRSGCDLCRRAA